MELALFAVSADFIAPADPRSSVSVRLLGVAVGVLDTNKPRGTLVVTQRSSWGH